VMRASPRRFRVGKITVSSTESIISVMRAEERVRVAQLSRAVVQPNVADLVRVRPRLNSSRTTRTDPEHVLLADDLCPPGRERAPVPLERTWTACTCQEGPASGVDRTSRTVVVGVGRCVAFTVAFAFDPFANV